MQNPNQLAKDLSKWKWIWATNKWDLIGTSAFLSLFIILPIVQDAPYWYLYPIGTVAFWFLAVWLRLTLLYKKNLRHFYEWEYNFNKKT